jgi:hypothetical protein
MIVSAAERAVSAVASHPFPSSMLRACWAAAACRFFTRMASAAPVGSSEGRPILCRLEARSWLSATLVLLDIRCC